jgi:F0F1-type ATP synthase membrane subunit c/vacuolar-type H+-ATPase subunit K
MTIAHDPQGAAGARPSVGELLGRLAGDTGTLLRQEIQLAKVEVSQKAGLASRHAGLIALGIMVGVVSLNTLSATLVLSLSAVMDARWAGLIVGLAFAVVAVAVGLIGLSGLRRMSLEPAKTIQTIRETKAWLHQQIR